jgi:glycerol kinase
VTTIAWVHEGEPTYAFEGITNFTGATIAWLVNQLKLIDNPVETENIALSVDDNGGVYLVPAFVGLSAPYWQPEAKAAILGLTPHSTRNHVVRAALESIAYRIRDVLDLMAKDAGITLTKIHADGGAVQNQFLMQFVADMLQINLRASSLPEFSALGATLSGFIGMGFANTLESLHDLPRDFIDYNPKMSVDHALSLYSAWKEAVERIL